MVPARTVIDVYDEIFAFRLGFPLPHYLRTLRLNLMTPRYLNAFIPTLE